MSTRTTKQHSRYGLAVLLLAAVTFALGAAAARDAHAAPGYTMTDLGTLGGFASAATAINNNGQVIGQSLTADFATHSFIWTRGVGMVDLGTLGGMNTQALALSDAGHVVGWSDTAGGNRHAFAWTPESGIVDLGTFGGLRSRAAAVNDFGRVVGWSETSDGTSHAFTWTAATGAVDLGIGLAADVNNAGVVVGGSNGPFLWTQSGGKVPLGTFGGVYGSGVSINERGEITGTSQTTSGGSEPFFWSAATGMVAIGSPDWAFAVPVAINGSSEIAGWGSPASGGASHAFVWTRATGIVDLGTPGGSVTVQGLNDSGQIVGSATGYPAYGPRIFSWTAATGFVDFGPFPGGPFTVSVNAAGEIAANADLGEGPHAVVWSPAGIPPAITSSDSATFIVGEPGTFTVTTTGDPTAMLAIAGDLPDGIHFVGNGDGTATFEGVPGPGSGGIYPVEITAANGIEPDVAQAFTLHVEYVFGGFFRPIVENEVNATVAGSAIPIKFALGGDQGLGVLAPGSPSSAPVACSTGAAMGASAPVDAPGASRLTYDASANEPDGLYTYVWKSDRSWSGTCRQLQLTLVDGRTYSALFRFDR